MVIALGARWRENARGAAVVATRLSTSAWKASVEVPTKEFDQEELRVCRLDAGWNHGSGLGSARATGEGAGCYW